MVSLFRATYVVDLAINYTVSNFAANPYSFAVYASPNGTTLDKELWRGSGGTNVGTYTLTFPPSFDDWKGDYYLIAVAYRQLTAACVSSPLRPLLSAALRLSTKISTAELPNHLVSHANYFHNSTQSCRYIARY